MIAMLTHYFELHAIPQVEITDTEVMNQLMQSLHQLLPQYQGQIALSFPRYIQKQYKTLGNVIRLFGDEKQLLALKKQLSNQSTINDYAIIAEMQPIPETITHYLRVSRVRQKGQSALRRAEKRLTAQGKWSNDVQQRMIEKWGSVELKYPHCHLNSSSTGQRFILWVKQEQCDIPQSGNFNNYGMSQVATVPDFLI